MRSISRMYCREAGTAAERSPEVADLGLFPLELQVSDPLRRDQKRRSLAERGVAEPDAVTSQPKRSLSALCPLHPDVADGLGPSRLRSIDAATAQEPGPLWWGAQPGV